MNVTVTLDSSLVREAKHEAVDRGVSLSALITQSLKRELAQRTVYDAAMKRSLRVMEDGLDLDQKTLTRDEIHTRGTEGDTPS